jgi:hypothetical protein
VHIVVVVMQAQLVVTDSYGLPGLKQSGENHKDHDLGEITPLLPHPLRKGDRLLRMSIL